MADLLSRAVEHLMTDELEHRRKFREHPLGAELPHTLGYMLEKIGEGLRDPTAVAFGLAGVESVRAAVGGFRAALDERGIGGAYEDSVGEVLTETDFVLERLAARLNGEMSQWAERDGDVYWYFLHGKVDELRRLTWEIDEDYASDDV